jgi:Zn-finger nucleic acid-binding protein
MRQLNCPRCDQPMVLQTIASGSSWVIVDVCATGCGGIWLDEVDMQSGFDVTDDLQAVDVQPSRTPDISQPAACPICHQRMQRYRWNYTSPVTLDQCSESHGTWIDAGEVQAMEAYEEQEVLPDSKKQQLQARLGLDRMELETELQRATSRWRRFL